MRRLVASALLLLASAAQSALPVRHLHGSLAAQNDVVTLPLTVDDATVECAVTGTWTGTITWRTANNGTAADGTFATIDTKRVAIGSTTTTINGTFVFRTAGVSALQSKSTAVQTGTAVVDCQPSTGIPPSVEVTAVPTDQTVNVTKVGGVAVAAVANDATATGNGVETQPAVARNGPATLTVGRSEKLTVGAANGAVFATLFDQATTNGSSIVANDTTNIANGLETQPAVGRASPTSTAIGKSEKLQMNSANGALFTSLVSGNGDILTLVANNDNTAWTTSLQALTGIAKAAPTPVTAGRAEALEMDTVSGGVYGAAVATTTAVGLTSTVFSANTALNIKASAGNVYGFAVGIGTASTGVCYLQFYNTAGAPTCGTSVIWSMPVSQQTYTSYFPPGALPLFTHSTGIAICVSTTQTGGTTCPTTFTGSIIYK